MTLNSKREGTKVGRTVGKVTSLEGKLVNSRTPENSDLFKHLFMHVLSSLWSKQLTCAFHAGHPITNLHSCNQTRLEGGDSQ